MYWRRCISSLRSAWMLKSLSYISVYSSVGFPRMHASIAVDSASRIIFAIVAQCHFQVERCIDSWNRAGHSFISGNWAMMFLIPFEFFRRILLLLLPHRCPNLHPPVLRQHLQLFPPSKSLSEIEEYKIYIKFFFLKCSLYFIIPVLLGKGFFYATFFPRISTMKRRK